MQSVILSAAILATGALAGVTVEPAVATTRAPSSTLEPAFTAIQSAEATAKPLSPVSNVKGAGFDRFIQIWLENVDYVTAAADPNMQWLATQGLLLTNYFGTTHPSEPNYAAVAAGDNFGMDNDDFNNFPANISTVVDLLDVKGISWGEYQEAIPYAGFEGFNYSNQVNFANDYVRKHNPLILFESVNTNDTRRSLIKGFDSFESDLAAQTLPQWSFITPNMTDDGHDTNITFTAQWTRNFLEPLLNNSYFMDNTLVIVTFDESEDYAVPNRVFTVLLGGALDSSLKGTTDSMYYNHYSAISTVSVNWGLPSLGRWDCSANVFSPVATATKYENTNITLNDDLMFNISYPGAMSDFLYTAGWWPAPNTQANCAAGLGVLPSIQETWANSTGTFNYTNVYPYDGVAGIMTAGVLVDGVNDRDTNATSTTSGSGSSTSSAAGTTSTTSAATAVAPQAMTLFGLIGLVAAFL